MKIRKIVLIVILLFVCRIGYSQISTLNLLQSLQSGNVGNSSIFDLLDSIDTDLSGLDTQARDNLSKPVMTFLASIKGKTLTDKDITALIKVIMNNVRIQFNQLWRK